MYSWRLPQMARIAGLRLQDRWGGWSREPFTAASSKVISVYARPKAELDRDSRGHRQVEA